MAKSKKAPKRFTAQDLEVWIRERYREAQIGTGEASQRVREMDARIRQAFERTVAVMVLDMAGFTRITLQHGIIHYLSLIYRMRELCVPAVKRHKGTLVKLDADNLFAHFSNVDDAIAAALSVREVVEEANFDTDDDFDIYACMGIGYGPILVLSHDMWGSEFNIASKLGEDVAGTGEIWLSGAARDALKNKQHHFRKRTLTLCGVPYDAYLLKPGRFSSPGHG
ncbi:MAG: adenylate/guanylate cyclase domain-containing protein [Planctomycetes bacterium]|nr:adenylate/guanylate cyclase domain-containing protein [Planctomycetota bacterium]